jgi:Universal stress protein family
MQHILIPTDFSKNAWNATAYALRFFDRQKIVFHFLHIDSALSAIQGEALHHNGIACRKGVSSELKTKMDDWMQQVFVHYPNSGHIFRDSILQAPFIGGIREYVAKQNIDFIVMGTKGASGLKEMTIGSRTGAVIKRVKCPILVIPEEAIFKVPLSIGFPTDFNTGYKQRVIHALLDISNTYKTSVKVLRVAQNQKPLDNFQKTNRESLKQYLADVSHSFHLIENPNLENALQSFVNTMQIDMVAMIAKNLNFFQRILFNPQVAKISYHMRIPFLVLHE